MRFLTESDEIRCPHGPGAVLKLPPVQSVHFTCGGNDILTEKRIQAGVFSPEGCTLQKPCTKIVEINDPCVASAMLSIGNDLAVSHTALLLTDGLGICRFVSKSAPEHSVTWGKSDGTDLGLLENLVRRLEMGGRFAPRKAAVTESEEDKKEKEEPLPPDIWERIFLEDLFAYFNKAELNSFFQSLSVWGNAFAAIKYLGIAFVGYATGSVAATIALVAKELPDDTLQNQLNGLAERTSEGLNWIANKRMADNIDLFLYSRQEEKGRYQLQDQETIKKYADILENEKNGKGGKMWTFERDEHGRIKTNAIKGRGPVDRKYFKELRDTLLSSTKSPN